LAWKDVEPGEFKPGSLVRGQTSIEEISGAITERDIEAGETLMVDELLLPSDRRFLSAVLRPNMRAVSIAVDAPQSSSGLVLPGDYVDVILTQNLSETAQTLARKSVAETMLRNARVIAVDQSLSKPVRPETADAPVSNSPTKVPETVTLELSERQAEMLFVAMQLGTLQLSVRPLEASGDAPVDDHRAPPTWASDVSPALNEVGGKQPVGSGSSIENLIRRPPAQLF
jgi:pilus assembly protein CpaB